jgi:hypothetical protein
MKPRLLLSLALVIALVALRPRPALAVFHLWKVKEVYSNSDGSIQYIELFSASGSQNAMSGHTITANSDGTVRTFTFGSNLVGSTASKHLLIATPGFALVPGAPTPNYILPCGPFFTPGATSITIDFGEGTDTITFAGSTLPTDGENSLTDTDLGAGQSLMAAANSPTNFAGTAGNLNLTACQIAGTCEPCDDGMFCNGPETCSASACTATPPCPQQCLEGSDSCVECITAGHCNDSNPCTDDSCDGSNECVNDPNTDPCDDGLFCNGADTCGGGTCNHAGDPCAPDGCLEGSDTCGDCDDPGDCDDGLFCTGDESCTGGACSSAGDPCDPIGCDEDGDQCDMPDAGVPDAAAPDATPDAPDAAPAPDAGDEGGGGGGCCRTGTGGAASGLLIAALVGLALRPRRNRKHR